MRRVIKSFPEAITVISQNGRPDDGTDATSFFNAEFFVPLKPFDTWPGGVDKEARARVESTAVNLRERHGYCEKCSKEAVTLLLRRRYS